MIKKVMKKATFAFSLKVLHFRGTILSFLKYMFVFSYGLLLRFYLVH